MSRQYYAIKYAYGRTVVNNGNRADYIYRFETKAERVRWLDEQDRAGVEVDPLDATHRLVKRALREMAAHPGGEWPVAV